MSKRLLLVGGDHFAEKARAIDIDPVRFAGTPDRDALLQAARDHRVDGLLACNHAALAPVVEVTHALNLPCLGLEWLQPGAKLECLQAMRAAALPVAAFHVVPPQTDAPDPAEAIETPAWVETCAGGGAGMRFRVEHEADFPLAFVKARKIAPNAPVWVQRAWAGPVYRLLGFKRGREFAAVEIVAEQLSPGPFPTPLGLTYPPTLSQHDYQDIIEIAAKAARNLPCGCGLVALELALDGDAPLLIGCAAAPVAHPAYNDLLVEALGIDLERDCLRVAVGDMPLETPRRALAAAVRWIPSHSGVIETISGVEQARNAPGVRKATLAAAPGHALGHVVDEESRDRIGYVLAVGARREDALAHAAEAVALIRIATRQTVA
ncbi:MAG TPA: hypothetical protein PKI11_03070 [Candidatus Hydrogenedentes bacterium]|nr:hypothetical protein [Candidatus Hydrogenedentota bacterium]